MANEATKGTPGSQDGLIDDPLTGMASRRYLITKGEQDISLAIRYQESVSVLQFEIDELKNIYNQYGDEVADELLMWVAKTLKTQCRMEDVAARISGVAFAVLAPRTNAAQALQMCARLRAVLMDRPFVHNDIRLTVTFSIGVAVLGNEAEKDVEGLLKVAALRAAEARQHGGNCVVAEAGNVVAMAAGAEPVSGNGRRSGDQSAGSSVALGSVTLEEALDMLATHQRERLQPHIAGLIRKFIPLLEYGNKELNLSLSFAIEAMKKRLDEAAIEREFGDD